MTAWKVTLLAAQWLLLSTQSIHPIVEGAQPLKPKYQQQPMALQEQMLPPKEFDYHYDGELTVNYLSQKEIQIQCWPARRNSSMLLACTRALTPKRCEVWMMAKDDLDRLGWNHEIIMRRLLGLVLTRGGGCGTLRRDQRLRGPGTPRQHPFPMRTDLVVRCNSAGQDQCG